ARDELCTLGVQDADNRKNGDGNKARHDDAVNRERSPSKEVGLREKLVHGRCMEAGFFRRETEAPGLGCELKRGVCEQNGPQKVSGWLSILASSTQNC